MTHRITLLLEYTKLLETVQVKQDEDPAGTDETDADPEEPEDISMTEANGAPETDTMQKPVKETSLQDESEPEKAAVKKPRSDSKRKKTVKKTVAVSAAKKTAAPKVSEAKPAAKVQSAAKKTVSGSEADKDNPDESLLNAVGILLPRKGMEWSGTATELADQLTEITLPPNMITRKLNESAETLLAEYGVSYERTRTHSGRTVKLTRVTAVAAGKTRKTRGKAKKKDGEK